MRAFEPDVVLLDLHLPDSLGPKSLSNAFTQAALSKVIVFSGDNRTAIRDLILKSGVHGFLLKSEPLEVVVKSIRSVMTDSEQIVSASLLDKNDGKLTRAEEHLLTLIARGMKYKDIGKERFTAPETVRKQVEQILDKLSLESREELIAWAVENGYGNLEAER
ncbi:MAG: response regulator transcription factor [Candidatus Obscuribacterales bacterium]|nr:response regulator transcription factor [Candidatus Obscuribacterales bacterium]